MAISMDFDKKRKKLENDPADKDMNMLDQNERGLLETLYLTSVPGMKERLLEGQSSNIEDSEPFEW
jgi:hypothetical protein